ncbi:MAG TPA: anthranilate synthase family protein [Nocardioidaceae bacterium]|jgi:phenazine biosynthesis protein phzE
MSLVDDVVSAPAYALVRLHGDDHVTLLTGRPEIHAELAEVPLDDGRPEAPRLDRLVCLPFSQIRERGFRARMDDAQLVSIEIEHQSRTPIEALVGQLPDEPISTVGEPGFDIDDAAYAEIVRTVIDSEIGNGEGANLVIARNFTATIADWSHLKALTVFRRLLERERGAYWTFVVFTGDRFLIGASPERHISVRSGEVRMNPISGTFRVGSAVDAGSRKQRLMDFLADEKEIYELFMVVDEELKMMCDICSEGGQILGPYLKPMTHLIHTEYILAGRTHKDVRDVLRSSMYAATVTGSPVENACRLIEKYEQQGRGYYGAVLALLGRDSDGGPTVDAPIVLRTADVRPDGRLRVTAGATLVRDSQPAYEVAETHAKAGGILTAFGLAEPPATPATEIADLAQDEDVLVALGRRNQRLSRFWFNDQSDAERASALSDRHVVVLDGEDDFVTMLRHMLAVLGMTSETVRHHDYRQDSFDGADLVILGPGPGDPRERDDPKIKAVRAAVDDLLARDIPFLAVCLGHQVLSSALGLELAYKDIVFQGTQTRIDLHGSQENVGFYNTFVAKQPANPKEGLDIQADPKTGDVHLLAGRGFRGIQFHAESILTENGFDLVRRLLVELLDL